ncbi:MAG TPA: carboxymuconolactone decarboxylase family protein [Solirubrobacterales bacterium]|jgi:4-carboxymuconolactone decarboxylase|nr:carboxymuconolactone decarboxylase family protein [Solirubrobacterales bacterium]
MTPSDFSRAEVGKELRERAQGAMAPRLQEALGSLDPELAEIADDFIFGRVWTGEGIAFEERMLVAITALAAGDHQEQLRNYLHGALQAGIEAEKLHEALKMLVVYCGFPTALHALGTFTKVRDAHEKHLG